MAHSYHPDDYFMMFGPILWSKTFSKHLKYKAKSKEISGDFWSPWQFLPNHIFLFPVHFSSFYMQQFPSGSEFFCGEELRVVDLSKDLFILWTALFFLCPARKPVTTLPSTAHPWGWGVQRPEHTHPLSKTHPLNRQLGGGRDWPYRC